MEYKELFNRAKAAYGTGAYDDATLEFIFPELAESEDEKIRKHLIEIVETYWGTTNEPGKAADLAWLEKQKEQKPVEWSETDEEMFDAFMHKLEVCDLLTNKEIMWAKLRLKSLRPQPIQVKESYKEGFQTARHVAASAFMEYLNKNRPNGKMCLSNGECEDIENAFSVGDWAKIERYIHKYHWKPSKEQMNVLEAVEEYAVQISGYWGEYLHSLAEDLRKL